jgi:spermidine/putrescine transport system permease protein
MLMGNLIQQQFGQSRDFPFGAAISFGLIILSLVALLFYQRKAKGAQIL